MMKAFGAGVSSINAMAAVAGARVIAIDCGVGRPTANFRHAAALDVSRFEEAVALGRTAVAGVDADLLVVGEMGIGKRRPPPRSARACIAGRRRIGSARHGHQRRRVPRQGERGARRAGAPGVRRRSARGVAPGWWRRARRAGTAVVEARRRSIPVVLDGYGATAPAAALDRARVARSITASPDTSRPSPGIAPPRPPRPTPLLDLDFRLGEASGAMAAVPLIAWRAVSSSSADVRRVVGKRWVGCAPPSHSSRGYRSVTVTTTSQPRPMVPVRRPRSSARSSVWSSWGLGTSWRRLWRRCWRSRRERRHRAFHHDGLADTADAFWWRLDCCAASRDPEGLPSRHLRRHGHRFGRRGTGDRAGDAGSGAGFAALVAAHSLGRAGAVVLMMSLPVARPAVSAPTTRSASTVVRHRRSRGGALLATIAMGWWVVPASLASPSRPSRSGPRPPQDRRHRR